MRKELNETLSKLRELEREHEVKIDLKPPIPGMRNIGLFKPDFRPCIPFMTSGLK